MQLKGCLTISVTKSVQRILFVSCGIFCGNTKNCYNRPCKRKFHENQHSQGTGKRRNMKRSDVDLRGSSVSAGKVKPKADYTNENDKKAASFTGYRLFDMEFLCDVFKLMPCKNYGAFQRHGCSSCLCSLCMVCGWKH